ncbi:MAG: T9SS type A sorting domain-containing protein [Bacteroidota bacterium]
MRNVHLLATILFALFINSLLAQPFEIDPFFGENGEIVLPQNNPVFVTAKDQMLILTTEAHQLQLERMTRDGAFDANFGDNGKITLNFDQRVSAGIIREQADGRILIIGAVRDSLEKSHLLLIRLLENGQLDFIFEHQEVVLSNPLGINNSISNAAIQKDSQLILVGQQYTRRADGFTFDRNCLLMRVNLDGQLDTTFGNQGIVLTNFDNRGGNFSEVAITQDGKIITAGDFENKLRERDWSLARFTADGVRDSTFGRNGIVTMNIDLANDFLTYMEVLEDDRILMGGSALNRIKSDIALIRFTSNGQIDSTFGNQGMVLTDISGKNNPVLRSSDRPTSIIRRLDGRILVCGHTHTIKSLSDYRSFFLQYTADGHLDQDFGDNGLFIMGSWDSLHLSSLALQSDGKILARGGEKIVTGRHNFIRRYLPDFKVSQITSLLANGTSLIYPNPIKKGATLEYTLDNPEVLTIRLLDLHGRIVATYLQNTPKQAGVYQQLIELPNSSPKGMYFVRLSSPNGQMMIKVMK